MIHNLKSLGLVLAAGLAMSAVTASPAFAQQGKLTSDGLITLDMTPITGKSNALIWFGEEIKFGGHTECPGSVLTGHKYNVTPHEMIPNGATTITITPHLVNCTAFNETETHKMTMTMNGCDQVLHIGETISVNHYSVTASIACPAGKDIQDEVYAFAGSELGGVQCTVTVKPQSGLTGPTLTTDTVNDDLAIEGTFMNVHVERSGAGCASETSTGQWDINVTVKGTSAAKAPTGVTVTH